MASTLLEQTREAHEAIERLERFIVSDFKTEAVTHKERLAQNHRVNRALDEMASRAKRLRATYEDADGARKEEIAALGGGANVFAAFYDRLRESREYHRAYSGFHAADPEQTLVAPFRENVAIAFSGEEANGRYLDLHFAHRAFVNGAFGRKCEYISYLVDLGADGAFASSGGGKGGGDDADDTKTNNAMTPDRAKKFTRAYGEYLDGLLAYLGAFCLTLVPIRSRRRGVTAALKAAGLKAGGTATERAARLWSTRGRTLADLDAKLFNKGLRPASAIDGAERAKREARAKDIARREHFIAALLEHLSQVLDATKGNVEKKATLSAAELEAEAEEDDDFVEEEASDEDEEVYNPLKLPLGWDGKPIPYWLYKLHGLNLEFTCEICGNYSYWGRRAFEQHFKQFRHVHGMRCLGIPNTKAFAEVTSIADALSLHKALDSRKDGKWDRKTDEEYEDADGNVYNKKTYEDLRKQGLI
ncbi:uncharacterized protein MICPUCDRAFT_42844 [Micromonas pusilla CCMP1545]|uniref:Predicted protein n=1 Tax=Micromonas pusilla (strain CCMP1545) TaxID=564608 RepID=C1N6F1_MICPC|nr:uncharacterized protein MICPUCDRAFT_42844 [Micromonas pusilla CCMP1545]EEH52657.1 predicted protein [Micromonas pusilla CCMP1545]|eukprot:XP_003063521.1 predicted protein [Micromonas pusilla CCMP1545]